MSGLERLRRRLAESVRRAGRREQAGDETQGSEELYRASFQQAADPILLIDPKTQTVVDLNVKARSELGFIGEEPRGLKLDDFETSTPTGDAPHHLERVIREGAATFYTRCRTRSGETRDIQVSANVISIRGRELVQWICRAAEFDGASSRGRPPFLVDETALLDDVGRQLGRIGRHKQAREPRRDVEARFRTLFESAPIGIAVTTREGDLLEFNEEILRMSGYTSEELDRLDMRDLFEDPSEHKRLLEQLDSRGIVRVTQMTLKRADETTCEVRMTVAPIVLGGRSVLLALAEDVSDSKREEVRRERLLSAIEQAAEVIIIITDTHGTMQYVNAAFEESTGYTREEALGQNPRILKSGVQDEAFYRELWKTVSSGKTWQGRMVNRRKDGSRYTGESTISPVRDWKGNIINYVAVMRDMTRELELENQLRQAQKLESVGRLAGGVAHDFNNMLGVILGNAELALQQLRPADPLREEIQEILNAGQRSAELTRRLLAFARRQTISPSVLDLNEVIASMLKILRRMIGEDIYLIWRSDTKPWRVKIDPGQVDQILANLVVNARDAIRGVGEIRIETGKARFDEVYCDENAEFLPGDYVVLTVDDTGSGMDRATLAAIFEPFFTTKTRGEGTGLGLATVYGIVKQNEGFIHVYSEPGKGSTFRIYFPRFIGEETQPSDDDEVAVMARGSETVLLVEDDATLLKLSRRQLGKLGYNVLATRDPEQAMKLAADYPSAIHLLVTDVVMPGMSGLDLYRGLTATLPDLKCLYMSGYTADVIAHRGILDQDVHFLQKPFDIRTLASKIREALRG